MASNLDYLDPALIPLEEKAKAFLETEKALHRASEALKQAPTQANQPAPAGDFNQQSRELAQAVATLKSDLARLEAEILALLPTRDEWVKVNLGYGPSRVGAWHVPATPTAPERYKVRVVH